MKNTSFFLRNYKIIFFIASIAIFAVCCKSTKSTTVTKVDPLAPALPDVTIAQAHWTGTTLNYLNEGYSIYSDKCVACHETKRPQDFTVTEWNSILPNMGRKANLDSNQYKMVFRYVLTKREAILGPGK